MASLGRQFQDQWQRASGRLPSFAKRWLELFTRGRVLALLLFAVVLYWLSISRLHSIPAAPSGPPPPPPRRYELFGLRDFGEEVKIRMLEFHVNETEDATTIPLNQHLQAALSTFDSVNLENPPVENNPASIDKHILETIPTTKVDVTVAKQNKQPDASHLTIGLSTSLERVPETLQSLSHWAADTHVRFILLVAPHNPTERPNEPTIAEATELFQAAGIPNVKFFETENGWVNGFVEMIGLLADNIEPGKTQWVSLMDDDTFMFSMSTLLAELARFDPSRPWYVGQISENKWNIDAGGIAAMGGAGIFLSVPLLQQIAPHRQACYDHDKNGGGDMRVADCIYTYTTTKLSPMHGLYQLDLHGDVTGFYEAVRRQPISVHHWKSWHHHDLPSIAKVSTACGQACVLQHFRFEDDWQMTNGFSIVRYSYSKDELATQIESAMEHTWKLTIWDIPTSWKYSLEPLKPKDEGKVQYMMERMIEEEDGLMVDYVRRVDGAGVGLIRVKWQKGPKE